MRYATASMIFTLLLMAGCSHGPRVVPDANSPEAKELYSAVERNDAPAVKTWLGKGKSPDIIYSDSSTVLHLAAGMGKSDCVVALLTGKANPNIARDNGRTPLHYAAQFHTPAQLSIITMLLSAGADPDARDRDGKMPYDLAVADKNDEVAEVLKKASEKRP